MQRTISRTQMNVSTMLAMFYAALHIGPKALANLVPAIYTSLPRALPCGVCANLVSLLDVLVES